MSGRIRNNKGQATAELAIMGTIVIMLLGYLMQQGFIYNARQSLEMYTSREALYKSRQLERGVALTVMRDVFVPSFFSGLSRQRLMSSASVSADPWNQYIPDKPTDLPTVQLVQLGETMIRKGVFFKVPPTYVRVVTNRNANEDVDKQWQWFNSGTSSIDAPATGTLPTTANQKGSAYSNDFSVTENTDSKRIEKSLSSHDVINSTVEFEEGSTVRQNYIDNDWSADGAEEHVLSVTVDNATIPSDAKFILEETVTRSKDVTTDHN